MVCLQSILLQDSLARLHISELLLLSPSRIRQTFLSHESPRPILSSIPHCSFASVTARRRPLLILFHPPLFRGSPPCITGFAISSNILVSALGYQIPPLCLTLAFLSATLLGFPLINRVPRPDIPPTAFHSPHHHNRTHTLFVDTHDIPHNDGKVLH